MSSIGLELRVALVATFLIAVAPPAVAGEWQSPLIIPAAGFENSGVDPDGDIFYDSEGSFRGRLSAQITMMAAVQLPQGATLTKIEAAVLDWSDAPCSPSVYVTLHSYEYGVIDSVTTHAAMATTVNSSDMQTIQDTTIVSATINNWARAYFVKVFLCGPFQGFQAVRIHYTE